MLVYEYKVDATKAQYARMEEAIRVGQFVRNKCLRLWMDGANISANDLQIYCSQLAKDFPFVACLNSQARQSAADRTWQAINRFYQNCRQMKPGKKGYPRFRHRCRSVEYKQTGWKLEPDGRHLTFTDGCGIGRVRLLGTRDVASFPVSQIKRVRLLRRADGYYVQFALTAERCVAHVATGRVVGIDVGLISFYTDSNGRSIVNPRYLRNSERRLRVLSQRFSRKNTSSLGAKKPKVNHAARHRAKHNKYPPQQMSYATTVGTTLVPIPFSPDTSPPGNGTKRRSHSAKWQRAHCVGQKAPQSPAAA